MASMYESFSIQKVSTKGGLTLKLMHTQRVVAMRRATDHWLIESSMRAASDSTRRLFKENYTQF